VSTLHEDKWLLFGLLNYTTLKLCIVSHSSIRTKLSVGRFSHRESWLEYFTFWLLLAIALKTKVIGSYNDDLLDRTYLMQTFFREKQFVNTVSTSFYVMFLNRRCTAQCPFLQLYSLKVALAFLLLTPNTPHLRYRRGSINNTI